MKCTTDNQSFEIHILGFAYPPGWGIGTGFQADWVESEIITYEGDISHREQDLFFRYQELEELYENLLSILSGHQSDYYTDFDDPRLALSLEIQQDRDIHLTITFREDFVLEKNLTSEEFRRWVEALEKNMLINYKLEG